MTLDIPREFERNFITLGTNGGKVRRGGCCKQVWAGLREAEEVGWAFIAYWKWGW